jgi:uncharacterized LabA/DUF88 family protein
MITDELRRQADQFIDLKDQIFRLQRTNQARRPR